MSSGKTKKSAALRTGAASMMLAGSLVMGDSTSQASAQEPNIPGKQAGPAEDPGLDMANTASTDRVKQAAIRAVLATLSVAVIPEQNGRVVYRTKVRDGNATITDVIVDAGHGTVQAIGHVDGGRSGWSKGELAGKANHGAARDRG